METNPITEEVERTRELIDHRHPVALTDPRLGRVTRLRLVSDPGNPMWDLSYCYGELKDGTPVRVQLPWHTFWKRSLRRELVAMCKEAGVFAKGLGLLDESVVSKLT